MHDTVFLVAIVWLVALAGVVTVVAARVEPVAGRLVALDTLSYLLVAALAAVTAHRGEAGFLDIALAIAALGFIQTVAVARLVAGREGSP